MDDNIEFHRIDRHRAERKATTNRPKGRRTEFGDRNRSRSYSAAMKITDKRYFISPINQTWDKERYIYIYMKHENARSVRWKINQGGERKSRRHLEKHPRIVANRIARERSTRYQTCIYIYIYSIYPPFISPVDKTPTFRKPGNILPGKNLSP